MWYSQTSFIRTTLFRQKYVGLARYPDNSVLSMGLIYLSHSHPIAIYACPVPSHSMGRFPWDSHRNDIPMDKPADNRNR